MGLVAFRRDYDQYCRIFAHVSTNEIAANASTCILLPYIQDFTFHGLSVDVLQKQR